MNYKITVNDVELELFSTQVIGQTIQASNFTGKEVLKRTLDFTNQVEVPKTSHNINALGVPNNVKVNSTFPLTINRARIFASGMQIMVGNVVLVGVSSTLSLQFFSTAFDLKEKIGDSVLSQLDFQDSPITWNQTFMDSTRNFTASGSSPFISPLINYGQIESAPNSSIGDYYLPVLKYSHIINAIFYTAGYGWDPEGPSNFFTNDPRFSKMAMTYSRKDWPASSFTANQVCSDTMKQIDFLYDFQVKFNLFFRFNMSGATFFYEPISLSDVLADHANAVDWTDKRANKFEDISFSWGSWAKNNYLKYPNDDSGTFPNGSLVFNNQNLQAESNDAYTSIFDSGSGGVGSLIAWYIASSLVYAQGLDFTKMKNPVYTSAPSAFVFDNDPRPTLIICRDRDPGEGLTILYDGNVRVDFQIGYFENSDTVYTKHVGLSFPTNGGCGKGLLDSYYFRFQSALNNPKKVIREYVLTAVDINAFDIHRLIYDDGNYFLPLRLVEFVVGRITRVEMMLVSSDISATTTTTTTTEAPCIQYELINNSDITGFDFQYNDCDGFTVHDSVAAGGLKFFCTRDILTLIVDEGADYTLLEIGPCP